ncbi:MAG TPA: DUF932 domain-containing protein [Methanosarcina sp.]|nr:DUF932 domain-containing protein [Methanosarcina sp.]
MAHEIDQTNDKAAMAYVGDTPWHGLGQRLTEWASIDQWRIEAGMDWRIQHAAVNYADEDGVMRAMDNRRVFFRSDNKRALSVVSDNFKIVQPGQVLEFYKELVEKKGWTLETAGCLFDGRKFWAMAKVGESFRIMGQDEIKPYLLLASACDGSMNTVAHFTSVRVVCNNTLRMSVGSKGQLAQIRIPHQSDFDANKVKFDLGVADTWQNFLTEIQRLAETRIDFEQAVDIIAKELKSEWNNAQGDKMSPQEMLDSSNPLRCMMQLYRSEGKGAMLRSCRGTAWGVLNAVTEYCDHESGTKNGDKSRAFERAHLSDRATFKVKVAN